MTEFSDKTLVCRDCGKEFIFSVGEQEFYKDKGFENDPVRCPECRTARKHAKVKGKKSFEPLVEVTCDSCKQHIEYIPINDIGSTLLFQVSQRLSNTQINLIEMD